MGHRYATPAGFSHHHGFEARHHGSGIAMVGIALLVISSLFSAMGLGGDGAAGSLFFAIFAGIGFIAYGIYRRVTEEGTPGRGGRTPE